MDHRQRSRVVLGLFVIAWGVTALLDNLNVIDSGALQAYWPLILTAFGLLRIMSRPDARGLVFGAGLVVVGIAMTLNNLDVLYFRIGDWWPVFLIFGGAMVIARGFGPPRIAGVPMRPEPFVEGVEHGRRIDASAMLSGVVVRSDTQDFQGGEISAMLGSLEVDLTQAAIVTEARLRISVVMGGVSLRVPRDWSLSVNGSPVMGGIEDRTIPPATPGRRLVLDCSVALGAIELRN